MTQDIRKQPGPTPTSSHAQSTEDVDASHGHPKPAEARTTAPPWPPHAQQKSKLRPRRGLLPRRDRHKPNISHHTSAFSTPLYCIILRMLSPHCCETLLRILTVTHLLGTFIDGYIRAGVGVRLCGVHIED